MLMRPVNLTSAFDLPGELRYCTGSRPGSLVRRSPRRDVTTAFRGSSVVEQPAVNRLVVGSNPTRGARFHQLKHQFSHHARATR